ncbi:hypothetical protein M426DRAFT_318995 [Hypoxylon sp. CI-4A]|nr:hypothetical protein M426DRAFT_318995 [Hypoxylon sp. CI-4A]
MSSAQFLFLSPALPSELLTYILNHHVYPTTLIICSSRAEFLASLVDDVHGGTTHTKGITSVEDEVEPRLPTIPPDIHGSNQAEQVRQHRLMSSPLYQIATSRHIRVIYIPTVTHLRAYLSVFSPDDSRIPAPPANFSSSGKYPPHVILYGFLEMHRDTSEWSAQGLSNSASAAVDLGHRLSWQTIIVEPRTRSFAPSFEDVLREPVPFLSGGGRKRGPDPEEGGWAGRTVEVGRILKRWFRFQQGEWDISSDEDKMETSNDEI